MTTSPDRRLLCLSWLCLCLHCIPITLGFHLQRNLVNRAGYLRNIPFYNTHQKTKKNSYCGTNNHHDDTNYCWITRQRLPHQSQHTTMSRPSTQLSLSLYHTQLSLLHSNPSFCLTALLFLSTFGISLEQRTQVGKALSAPLATMALALIVANIGIIPFSSPIYNMVNKYLVPLAVSMLLFDSDLRRIFSDTGSLLLAFGIGALATMIATLAVYPVFPMVSLANNSGWKVACALAARHIGGAINFVAVAETLNIPATAVSAAIAADNVVVALYFAFLFAISKADEDVDDNDNVSSSYKETTGKDRDDETSTKAVILSNNELDFTVAAKEEDTDKEITLSTLGIAMSMASALVTLGGLLTKAILPTGTSALPLTSILTVCAATQFPKFFSRIRKAGTALGILCIQMFFAASGAAGSIALVIQQAPSLFAFSAMQIAVHFGILMSVGRGVFRLPPRELYLASNACVGGPTTAAAMAQAKGWKRLVLPALLIGILGYATATGLALAMGPILLRLPLLVAR